MRRPTLATVLLLAAPLVSADSLDHRAAPMMAPAQPAVSAERWAELHKHTPAVSTRSPTQVREEFRSRYAGAGSPRLAVFWERAFDDQLSDWQADRRSTLSIDAQSARERTGGSAGTEHRRDTVTVQAQQERRAAGQAMAAPRDPRVRNGFVHNLTLGGARVVDRAVLMRRVDRDRTDSMSLTAAPDLQRTETNALLEHADYLVEVRRVTDQRDIWEIHARDLRDGSVVALFRSRGEPRSGEHSASWVATSRGYEQRQRPITPEDRGEELALAVMEALSAAWQTP